MYKCSLRRASTIEARGRATRRTDKANVREGVADGMVAEIEQGSPLSLLILKSKSVSGANEEQADSMAFVSAAFLLALAIMFILLVSQFVIIEAPSFCWR